MKSENQKERLQKVKQGEGTFVYLGGASDTEAVPGVPLPGKDGNQARSVIFTTVEDSEGKKVQVVDPTSNAKGERVWKKAPQFKRIPIEVFKLPIPGVFAEHTEVGEKGVRTPSLTVKPDHDGKVRSIFLEFPKGKPVLVDSPALALKLRCLRFFKEVEAGAVEEAKPEGKKAKAESAKA